MPDRPLDRRPPVIDLDRRGFLQAGAAALAVGGLGSLGPARTDSALALPSAAQLRWQGEELSLFCHFGVNTFTDREWGDGTERPDLFDPPELDARQWARAARPGGFRSVILTAKHHDGFCLWPTRTTRPLGGRQSLAWRGGRPGARIRRGLPRGRSRGRPLSLALGSKPSRPTGLAPVQRRLCRAADRAPDRLRPPHRDLVRRRQRRGTERHASGLRLAPHLRIWCGDSSRRR